jgi:hypothetical protein
MAYEDVDYWRDPNSRFPKCPRCKDNDLQMILDRRFVYLIESMDGRTLILGEGDDTGVSWNATLTCRSCGHCWKTARNYETR